MLDLVLVLGAISVLMTAATVVVRAAELKPGDQAPGFSLPGSDGATHSLADLEGRVVVLAWFPKAFTGG